MKILEKNPFCRCRRQNVRRVMVMSHGKERVKERESQSVRVRVSLNDISRQLLHIVSGCLHCCLLQELRIVSDSFSVPYPAWLVYGQ